MLIFKTKNMTVEISPKTQMETNSLKKQTARNIVIIPTRNTLKKFAPLSIKIQPSKMKKWKPTVWEGKLEVERTFQEGPDDIYDPYYKFNAEKHHVWTNNLLIISGAIIDSSLNNQKHYLSLEDLNKYNRNCLDDPERHFYLKDLGKETGHGLFARHAIQES